MIKRGWNNRAQLALFVIFGILVVVGMIALFLALPKPEFMQGTSSKTPLQEIRPCISSSLTDVLPEFLEKGFYFEPSNTLTYNGKIVAYHCYTGSKETICTRNDAQSKLRIEELLKNKISDSVEKCFQDYLDSNKGMDISMGATDLSIEILPGKLTIKTRKEVVISRGVEESPEKFENFDVTINSNIWDYIRISNDILNQEVSCNCPSESCRADVVALMNSNRDYKITVYMGGRDDRVYTINDYYELNEFNFAIKNCDKSP